MSPIVQKMILSFLPDVKKEAAPVVEKSLLDLLGQYDDKLQECEDRTDIVIERFDGRIYVHICAMDEHNTVRRILDRWPCDELLDLLLKSLEKL